MKYNKKIIKHVALIRLYDVSFLHFPQIKSFLFLSLSSLLSKTIKLSGNLNVKSKKESENTRNGVGRGAWSGVGESVDY